MCIRDRTEQKRNLLSTEEDGDLVRSLSINFQLAQQLVLGTIMLVGHETKAKTKNGPQSILEQRIFRSVSCGYHHNLGLLEDGSVVSWGKNGSGQLGHGSFEEFSVPRILFLNSVKFTAVACGWQHSIALASDGSVYAWGCNEDGQLGIGCNVGDLAKPTKIPSIQTSIKAIRCGHSHSGALSESGELFLWGCNYDYRLMTETDENNYSPQLIALHSRQKKQRIIDFSLGVTHSALVTSEGTIYTGGNGTWGQLGLRITPSTPNALLMECSEPTDDENMEEAFCYLASVPTFNRVNKAIQVACGENFTLVLTESGQVFSFGRNTHGQLGLGIAGNEAVYAPTLLKALAGRRVRGISAGVNHAAALTIDDELFMWGFNFFSQITSESQSDLNQPNLISEWTAKTLEVSCGYFHSAILAK
eukprot:TRINITY_DN13752_c0_g1_i2.p1 TRINITY_DN13752_c0_g1~~TRINITY_DN13752_c0_g1_i2.p1  ORF type:complete len:418 (-),score=78.49 TRINITY_DN13752_c0_g1_i2:19-1272(-)